MNLEDFIHVETNVISHNFCKQIIEEYNDPNDWKEHYSSYCGCNKCIRNFGFIF